MQDLTKLSVFEVFEKVKARKITFEQFEEWIRENTEDSFWEGFNHKYNM